MCHHYHSKQHMCFARMKNLGIAAVMKEGGIKHKEYSVLNRFHSHAKPVVIFDDAWYKWKILE